MERWTTNNGKILYLKCAKFWDEKWGTLGQNRDLALLGFGYNPWCSGAVWLAALAPPQPVPHHDTAAQKESELEIPTSSFGGEQLAWILLRAVFPNMGIPNYFAHLISRDNAASVGKTTIPGLHFKWIFRQHISSLAHILGLGECFCNAKSFSIFERNYKFPFYLMSCKALVWKIFSKMYGIIWFSGGERGSGIDNCKICLKFSNFVARARGGSREDWERVTGHSLVQDWRLQILRAEERRAGQAVPCPAEE